MPSRQLYLHVCDLLHVLHEEPGNSLLVTLALLITGLILGRNVQFWELIFSHNWQSAGKGARIGAFTLT